MINLLMHRLRRRLPATRDEDGFTLVELMVVLVIIGLLATIVIINVLPAADRAAVTKAHADIATLEQGIEMYRLDNQRYPTTAGRAAGAGRGPLYPAAARGSVAPSLSLRGAGHRAGSRSWSRPGAPTAAKAVRGTMPTSPTDPEAGGAPCCASPTAARAAGARRRARPGPRLAVPGTEVAIHWLDLAGDLTPAQAAAAARLMLADASAEPLGDMHVAAGRAENGLTAVALAPVALMQAWLADGPIPT